MFIFQLLFLPLTNELNNELRAISICEMFGRCSHRLFEHHDLLKDLKAHMRPNLMSCDLGLIKMTTTDV